MPKISVVIPCYFNEGNIPVTTAALVENEQHFPLDVTFEYVFVDDESGDETLDRLLDFKENHPNKVTVVKLASNVGSYNAIYAGLKYATGDCIVVMAADLQDPPELILNMFEEWKKGAQVVIANREVDSGVLALVFNWLLRVFALPNLPKGGFDFCLFDSKAKEEILDRIQPNINSLYLLLRLDYPVVTIPYKKREREIGTTKWTTKKKLKLALNTLIWFSFNRVATPYFWKRRRLKESLP